MFDQVSFLSSALARYIRHSRRLPSSLSNPPHLRPITDKTKIKHMTTSCKRLTPAKAKLVKTYHICTFPNRCTKHSLAHTDHEIDSCNPHYAIYAINLVIRRNKHDRIETLFEVERLDDVSNATHWGHHKRCTKPQCPRANCHR